MKRMLCSTLIVVFAVGTGLLALATPVEATPMCFEYCDASTHLVHSCCWELIPSNPKCKGKNCPGEFDYVCVPTSEQC
jgi:hypothetical protein